MSLKKSLGFFAIAVSIILLGFDTYWYMFHWHDISSFLGFSLTSLLGIAIGIIFIDLERKVDRLAGNLEYVENKTLEHIEEHEPQEQGDILEKEEKNGDEHI
jgi:hypothetical protein